MNQCETCREFIFSERHACAPEFEVEINYARKGQPERWEPAGTARAIEASYAAERWAERHDADGDYTIVSGSPAIVRLRRVVGDEPWEVFEVVGETVPSYTAYQQSPKGR